MAAHIFKETIWLICISVEFSGDCCQDRTTGRQLMLDADMCCSRIRLEMLRRGVQRISMTLVAQFLAA